MRIGAVLVVVLGPAMLSQGGSLSGWISPDLLLVLIIAFCIVEVLFSFPVENRSVKSLAKAAFPVIVVGAYALWSFQGTLVQNSSAAENNVEVVDGVQVVNSTLQAGRYPDITVQAGVPTPAGYTIPTETLAVALPTTDKSGDEIQEVSIELTDNGFSPAVIVVQRDLPVYWNIENNLTDAENGTIDRRQPFLLL